jgi:hypothetical protein
VVTGPVEALVNVLLPLLEEDPRVARVVEESAWTVGRLYESGYDPAIERTGALRLTDDEVRARLSRFDGPSEPDEVADLRRFVGDSDWLQLQRAPSGDGVLALPQDALLAPELMFYEFTPTPSADAFFSLATVVADIATMIHADEVTSAIVESGFRGLRRKRKRPQDEAPCKRNENLDCYNDENRCPGRCLTIRSAATVKTAVFCVCVASS